MIEQKPQVLQIVRYPSEILNKTSELITTSIPDSQELQSLIKDMIATMQSWRAVGLSAVQIGVPARLFVVQDERQEPITLINPVIKETDGWQYGNEGCLSLPGLFLKIRRPQEVTVSYFNERGEFKTSVFTDLLARAVLHENEHLNGSIYWDNLSKVEVSRAKEKFKKIVRKF